MMKAINFTVKSLTKRREKVGHKLYVKNFLFSADVSGDPNMIYLLFWVGRIKS
jgi:hypothetical protein